MSAFGSRWAVPGTVLLTSWFTATTPDSASISAISAEIDNSTNGRADWDLRWRANPDAA
jgi:hypothetical protein